MPVTREQYDAVRSACGWLERPPTGGPAMAEVGLNTEPKVRFFAAHEVFLPSAASITAS